MRPLDMTSYRSAPSSARVAMTHADAKPHAYRDRVQALVDKGHTPITAMHILERRDHRQALPPSMDPCNNGGRGKARPKHDTPLTTRCLAHLTHEWQSISDDMAASIGSKRENIAAALRDLRDLGRVDHMHGSGRGRAMWRLRNA